MGRVIHDEFTARPVSRQRKYQMRKLRDALCPICGDPLGHYKARCDKCVIAYRSAQTPHPAPGLGRPRIYVPDEKGVTQ